LCTVQGAVFFDWTRDGIDESASSAVQMQMHPDVLAAALEAKGVSPEKPVVVGEAQPDLALLAGLAVASVWDWAVPPLDGEGCWNCLCQPMQCRTHCNCTCMSAEGRVAQLAAFYCTVNP